MKGDVRSEISELACCAICLILAKYPMRLEQVLKLESLSYNLDLELSLFHVDLLLSSYNHLLDGFSLQRCS